MQSASLLIPDLLEGYRARRFTPAEVVSQLLDATDAMPARNIWITRLSRPDVMAYVESLDPSRLDALPLYGVPFVIKDNIDLAGVPTTAACPEFAYTPARSAFVVDKLIAAGAIPLGKTNLDQFATGLVGTRSPYGVCRNSFNSEFISGGSSSGSAVAVAMGLASFALGTDTAGSGRVPAAFNNVVGLKPSLGRLSIRGVVPACRSLDCVSIFALTAQDAGAVFEVAQCYDPEDPFSRIVGEAIIAGSRIGVPQPKQLEFFGDAGYAHLFDTALKRLAALGASLVEVDFEPFIEAARLLYEGPWLAERYAAVGQFIETHPDDVYPITAGIISQGKLPSAVQAYEAHYRLKALQRASEAAWSVADLIVTPTTGTVFSIDAVQADPIRLNTALGYYTNFMNLFDLAGVALPTGFREDGLPFGVTLVGPSGSERPLLAQAEALHRASGTPLGAVNRPQPNPSIAPARLAAGHVAIAVCGAHMQGLPLNGQLRERAGYLIECTHTMPCYRLYSLPGGPPERPGLVRVAAGGSAIEVEVWGLPETQLASFLALIPPPLGVGKVQLTSGNLVTGFLCEAYATTAAADITSYGGWRAYIRPKAPS